MPPKNQIKKEIDISQIPPPPIPPPELSTKPQRTFEENIQSTPELPSFEDSPEFESISEEQAPVPETETFTFQEPKQFSQPQVQKSQFLQQFSGRDEIERIESIAESIIQEKWDDLIRDIGDISLWRENVKTDINSIKQELIRTQDRFENLQKAVLGKVKDYDSNVRELSSEMKALQKVFEKILNPLTTNIKELSRITDELKSKRK